MTLTCRQLEQIMVESSLGEPATLRTPEALAFRLKMDEQTSAIHNVGGVVEILGNTEWDIEPLPPHLLYKW